MKRSLAIIISAAFKSGNIPFHKIRDCIGVSVRLRNAVEFGKFVTAVAAFFLRHIFIVANTRIFGIKPLKKVALFNRITSAFKFHTFNNRTNFRNVNQLNAEALNA